MSEDKKSMIRTSSSQKKKRHYSAERVSKINLRRRNLYAQLSPHNKEMLLSEWRAKNVQAVRPTLLVRSTERAFPSKIGVELPKQTTLRIQEPSPITEKVTNTRCANNPTIAFVVFDKGKNIERPIHVFETGSTSTAPVGRHDPPISVSNTPCTNNSTVAFVDFDKGKNVEWPISVFETGSTSAAPIERQDPPTSGIIKKGNIDEFEHFHTYLRIYYNMFAFTSLGVNYDKTLARRNHELLNFYIALRSDSGLDQRVYNLPTVSEVAALWLDQQTNDNYFAPHIRIYTHSNKSQLVNYYYGCYDPLQYPLLFPYGQNGWHCGIHKVIPPESKSSKRKRAYYENEQLPSLFNMCSIDVLLDIEAEVLQRGKRKRDTVSCREYYCYKLQMRDYEENGILHAGRLFQQYSVDESIKVETQRLDFASFNQDLCRMDILQGILDILRLGEREASKIGKKDFFRPVLLAIREICIVVIWMPLH